MYKLGSFSFPAVSSGRDGAGLGASSGALRRWLARLLRVQQQLLGTPHKDCLLLLSDKLCAPKRGQTPPPRIPPSLPCHPSPGSVPVCLPAVPDRWDTCLGAGAFQELCGCCSFCSLSVVSLDVPRGLEGRKGIFLLPLG